MPLTSQIDNVLQAEGLTMRHYGLVCVAANCPDVGAYTFRIPFASEGFTQDHAFCDLVFAHLGETASTKVDNLL